ncbi:SPRY domain-containing protein [Aphelenchoides avenae]|nr:SPRY domain-containing protein [Aphelenchus avenae]
MAPTTRRPKLSRDAKQPFSHSGTRSIIRRNKPKGAKLGHGSAAPSLRPRCTHTSKHRDGDALQCYERSDCGHRRDFGAVEIRCHGPCKKWYHRKCLYDYDIPNVPFMISYRFYCEHCANLKWPGHNREWLKFSAYADLDEFCVTALANLTFEWLVANRRDTICDYAGKYWLASVEKGEFDPARVTQELTLQILAGYPSLFVRNPSNPWQYALRETDLSVIGALNKDLQVLISHRLERVEPRPLIVNEHTDYSVVLPPKSCRRFFRVELDPAVVPSKAKVYTKYAQQQLDASSNLTPTYVHEKRSSCNFIHWFSLTTMTMQQTPPKELPALPTFACRLVHPKRVTLSPMDCDSWLALEDNFLTVSGRGLGGSTVRATHGVANGAWYFEATILEHPPGSAVRIGWAQQLTRADMSLGTQKNAYSWHSLTGKKFNDAKSQAYTDDGFGAGDVISCLIILPDVVGGLQKPPPHCTFSDFLPTSHKDDSNLVAVDNTLFFEYRPESALMEKQVVPNLPSVQKSKIEFFKNGRPCGTAFEGLCLGAYYPAVSIFGHAKVQCNFGPVMEFPVGLVEEVRPMADRAEQIHVEQAVSDFIENTVALSELF